LAALARSTSSGSEAGGSAPGQSTPRSLFGSDPAPSSNRGRRGPAEPGAPISGVVVTVVSLRDGDLSSH